MSRPDRAFPTWAPAALTALARSTSIGILLTDAEGRIEWENPAFERMIGVPEGEISAAVGLRLSELPNLHAAGMRPVVERFEAGGAITNIVMDFQSLLGKQLSLGIEGGPVVDEDGTRQGGWLLVQDLSPGGDLSGRLLSAQRMEFVGIAVSGIIHDLNNILTAMGGTLEMLRGGKPAGEPLLVALDGMLRRSRDVAARLIRVGKPAGGEQEPLDLRTPVRQAADLMRHGFGAGTEVEVSLPRHAVPILGERIELLQCLFNLGVNARDAMEGHGRISLLLEVVADASFCEARGWPGDSHARLTVNDTGPGIPAGTASRIFEPFYSTKAPDRGTGMGLSVVKRAVVGHDGHIEVRSRPGEGASFVIMLPLYLGPVDDDEPTRTMTLPKAIRVDRPPLERLRVLVADDEDALRIMLGDVLRLRGAEVTGVADGRSVVNQIQAAGSRGAQFDAAIVDLGMPGLYGDGLVRAIRREAPDLHLIAISGLEPTPDLAAVLSELGGDFLPKPFRLSEVVELLLRL